MSKPRLSKGHGGMEGFMDAIVSMIAVSAGSMILLATIAMVSTMPPADGGNVEGLVAEDGLVHVDRLEGILEGEDGMNIRVMALGHGVVWSSGEVDMLEEVECRPVLVSVDGRAVPGRLVVWWDRAER